LPSRTQGVTAAPPPTLMEANRSAEARIESCAAPTSPQLPSGPGPAHGRHAAPTKPPHGGHTLRTDRSPTHLPHHGLEPPVLLHRQDLLDPPPEGSRGRDKLPPESFHLTEALRAVDLSGPDALPEKLHRFAQRKHVPVHGTLQFAQLRHLVRGEPQLTLVFQSHIQGATHVWARFCPGPWTPLGMEGGQRHADTHHQRHTKHSPFRHDPDSPRFGHRKPRRRFPVLWTAPEVGGRSDPALLLVWT